MPRAVHWPALAGLFLAVASADARAELLPLKPYTSSNGFPGTSVTRIYRDSKGFVWFCTGEGLSRFDGRSFRSFGTDDGLPSPSVLDVLETRDGSYWLATGGGLCRLPPSPARAEADAAKPAVVVIAGDRGVPLRLLEDRAGTLWCGTNGGLCRIDREREAPAALRVDLGMPDRLWDDPVVTSLAEDGRGGLWVGAGSGLYRRAADGRVERFTTADGLPDDRIREVVAAGERAVWVATRSGVGVLDLDAGLRPSSVRALRQADGLPTDDVTSLHRAGDGRMWVGTVGGLCAVDAASIRCWGESSGIRGAVFSLEEDVSGDLWIGEDGAVDRLARNGMTRFEERDGLTDRLIDALLEDGTGALCAVRAGKSSVGISRFSGGRFERSEIRLPSSGYGGWGWNQSLLRDHLGEWWVPTGGGLLRFGAARTPSELASARPRRIYSRADGLPVDDAFVVYEDRQGDVWFSQASPVTNGLVRWRRETDRIEVFRDGEGLPPLRTYLPTAFAEDAAGSLWIAFNRGCVARYREGRFELLTAAHGVPPGWISSLLVDRAGRVWIGAGDAGLGVIDDPGAKPVRVRRLTVADGLSSNTARCLVEDAWGTVHVGTSVGVDRVVDARKVVQHITEGEGLAPGILRVAFRDRTGTLWFGTRRGLSRYVPSAPASASPPPVRVSGVQLSGLPRPLPAAGLSSLDLGELASGPSVRFEFVSPGHRESDAVRYEYRLVGASDRWTGPGGRSVEFANLGPGRYRFEVRAGVPGEGAPGEPASVRFTVLAPIWRRWWFQALVLGAAAAAASAAFRYRLRHLLELERVRTRIAADLHDDIGASLSRIAILSEVALRKSGGVASEADRFLEEIARTARELVESMSDIVWSVDPRRDDLRHLLARLGQFAGSTAEARGIRWSLEAADAPGRVKLTPEQRRATFLVLKEAINNALKHSSCRSLTLHVESAAGRVDAEVRDDGRGMPPGPEPSASSSVRRGRGLLNMKARAREIGGRLTIASQPGAGTTVRLELPLHPRGMA